jgi:copper homeostasis protein
MEVGMEKIVIEVCCGSVDDVVRAAEAGADRVELNSALFVGGLTPSVGSLLESKARAEIPVISMIRPRAGGFCYTELEFETMLRDTRELAKAGTDGFAVGFLTAEGWLDEERCKIWVEAAGGRELVFHRAFDIMKNEPEEVLPQLAELGFKRILTSGRELSAPAGTEMIRRCVEVGALQVLAGGGVRAGNVGELIQSTGCRQVHFSCHMKQSDTSVRGAKLSFGLPNLPKDEKFDIIDTERLADLVRLIRTLPKF